MRFTKIIIGCLTVILAGMVFVVSALEEPAEENEISLSFSVRSNGSEEVVHSWKDTEGQYYVFLPSYADLTQVFLQTGTGKVAIGDLPIKNGTSCSNLTWNTVYSFAYEIDGKKQESNITFVQSGKMPTLYLDTASGSMDFIHLDKTNEEPGTIRLYDEDGQPLYTGALDSLKGRGNTSWGAEKKPYNLTLSQDADLLGMGAAQRWILLADGYNKVNIRNKIVFDFADALGMSYSPDCEWVDLYLNGEYVGLYLLSERNEVNPERIDIAQNSSFLISMENEENMIDQKLPYVKLNSTQVMRIRYSSVTNENIKNTWNSLANALYSDDDTDSVSGRNWGDMVDLDSWVKKYLIEEVFGNVDGGAVSQFFYVDGADLDGKIYAGPVWDYDYAMGGEEYWMQDYPSFFVMAREYTSSGMYLPWFYEMYRKPAFYSNLTQVYETVFLPLLEDLISEGLDGYCYRIEKAAAADGIRWNYTEEEIHKELRDIYDFLETRKTFLTDLWINGTEYHVVQVMIGNGSSGYFAVKDGETLPDLPDVNYLGGNGWYDAANEEPFDIGQSIYQDYSIYVKKEETAIPKIHLVPGLVLTLSLTGLFFLDRYVTKSGRQKNAKP